ncbi:hypothetical protein [Deinococcus roseus]|uniref:Uncharacterized protein n=1 Tax=Deinococcus roseus TaxID=392414 RepID=A0ABQ2DGF9_9DEIO|nr:hypothetical protein [Deinococcus roseus]GGJ56892.1 hypothetical protein GCM10008938_48840 [Deinococcus roseus]
MKHWIVVALFLWLSGASAQQNKLLTSVKTMQYDDSSFCDAQFEYLWEPVLLKHGHYNAFPDLLHFHPDVPLEALVSMENATDQLPEPMKNLNALALKVQGVPHGTAATLNLQLPTDCTANLMVRAYHTVSGRLLTTRVSWSQDATFQKKGPDGEVGLVHFEIPDLSQDVLLTWGFRSQFAQAKTHQKSIAADTQTIFFAGRQQVWLQHPPKTPLSLKWSSTSSKVALPEQLAPYALSPIYSFSVQHEADEANVAEESSLDPDVFLHLQVPQTLSLKEVSLWAPYCSIWGEGCGWAMLQANADTAKHQLVVPLMSASLKFVLLKLPPAFLQEHYGHHVLVPASTVSRQLGEALQAGTDGLELRDENQQLTEVTFTKADLPRSPFFDPDTIWVYQIAAKGKPDRRSDFRVYFDVPSGVTLSCLSLFVLEDSRDVMDYPGPEQQYLPFPWDIQYDSVRQQPYFIIYDTIVWSGWVVGLERSWEPACRKP